MYRTVYRIVRSVSQYVSYREKTYRSTPSRSVHVTVPAVLSQPSFLINVLTWIDNYMHCKVS